jgi:hypothetical protein
MAADMVGKPGRRRDSSAAPKQVFCCALSARVADAPPRRAGTEIEELTANPEGGRSDTLGVGAGPASGRIRSPAIVPADIATPMPDPHLLWA